MGCKSCETSVLSSYLKISKDTGKKFYRYRNSDNQFIYLEMDAFDHMVRIGLIEENQEFELIQ